jgi:branched-chain amino acid transport system permease protein
VHFAAVAEILLFGLVWGGVYALAAGGLNLIFGVMKVLNVAHGELVMLSAYLAFWLFTWQGISPLAAVVVAGPAMALIGVVLYEVIVVPLLRSSRTVATFERATLIAFFGIILIFRDGALLLWTSEYRAIRYLDEPVTVAGMSIAPSRLVVLFVAVLTNVGMFYLLRRTRLGKSLRAVSQDRDTAQLIGLPVRRVSRWGFALGSLLAGVSGALLVMIYVISPSFGVIFTTKAFAICVFGGLGNYLGALIGAVVLGVSESVGSLVLGESYRDAVSYILLVVAILWRFRNPFAKGRSI